MERKEKIFLISVNMLLVQVLLKILDYKIEFY